MLNEAFNNKKAIVEPTHDCFSFNGSALSGFILDWEKGTKLEFENWAWQVSYNET